VGNIITIRRNVVLLFFLFFMPVKSLFALKKRISFFLHAQFLLVKNPKKHQIIKEKKHES